MGHLRGHLSFLSNVRGKQDRNNKKFFLHPPEDVLRSEWAHGKEGGNKHSQLASDDVSIETNDGKTLLLEYTKYALLSFQK